MAGTKGPSRRAPAPGARRGQAGDLSGGPDGPGGGPGLSTRAALGDLSGGPNGPDGPGGPGSGGLFPALDGDSRRALEDLIPLIEKTFPVPARFRRGLGRDVAELSRLLTSARGERGPAYLNRPPLLSAYLRYFLPWNLYRLCRLLPGLDLPLAPGDLIIDLGSGPLSFPLGLWICRRDLRALPLEFRCLDHSRAALEAGKRLFAALVSTASGGPCPWTVHGVHGDLGQARALLRGRAGGGPEGEGGRGAGGGRGAALVTALNLYNEMFQSLPPGDEAGQRRFADSQAALAAGLADRGGRFLVVEPGTPPSGRCIALLREALTGLGRLPLSPCVHSLSCPFPARGGRAAVEAVPDAAKSAARGTVKGAAQGTVKGAVRGTVKGAARGAVKGAVRGRGAPVRPSGFRSGPSGVAPGGEPSAAKWCHFTCTAGDAPAALHRLSAAAGLPKERVTLSFLLAGPLSQDTPAGGGRPEGERPGPRPAGQPGGRPPEQPSPPTAADQDRRVVRVISSPFPVEGGPGAPAWGRYVCAEAGMALLRGERRRIESLEPGFAVPVTYTGDRDPKSGAPVCVPIPSAET